MISSLLLLLPAAFFSCASAFVEYESDSVLEERAAASMGPVYTASFTWNEHCGASVACGPSMAGIKGTGTTAANNVTFAAGQPIEGGKGAGCGQCWHLQPMADPYPQNNNKWGSPVVAMINDQCTDGGYCDQTESRTTNTEYGKEKHFDLCVETGTADQFFGSRAAFGVLLGVARQVPCSMLKNGPQGSGNGPVTGADSPSSPPTAKPVPVAVPISPKPASPAPQQPWSNSSLLHLPGGQGGVVNSAPKEDVHAQVGAPSDVSTSAAPAASTGSPPIEEEDEQDECDADDL